MSDKHLDGLDTGQVIDARIKELVEYSHTFEEKYLEEKQECGRKGQEVRGIMREIKNNINIFNEVLKLRPELREEIAGFQGMTSQEIMERKAELESLLKLYQHFKIEGREEDNDSMKTEAIIKESERQINEAEPQAQKTGETTSTSLRLGLLYFQGICFFIATITILSSAYTHLFK